MNHQRHASVSRWRYLSLTLLVVSITLVAGAVHGVMTQRWGPAPDLIAASQHLADFPKQFGNWQMLSEQPMDESTVRMLSCAGYVNRQYVNRKTGMTIWIAVMLGPSGPIAVHTPEVCYSSRDYSINEPRHQVSLVDANGRTHTFWSLSFRSDTPSTDQLRVDYAWYGYGQDQWKASTSPRFEFAGKRLLFKLQIAGLTPAAAGNAVQDPCEDFLSAFLRSGWSVSG
jgi:hypothetical protein